MSAKRGRAKTKTKLNQLERRVKAVVDTDMDNFDYGSLVYKDDEGASEYADVLFEMVDSLRAFASEILRAEKNFVSESEAKIFEDEVRKLLETSGSTVDAIAAVRALGDAKDVGKKVSGSASSEQKISTTTSSDSVSNTSTMGGSKLSSSTVDSTKGSSNNPSGSTYGGSSNTYGSTSR